MTVGIYLSLGVITGMLTGGALHGVMIAHSIAWGLLAGALWPLTWALVAASWIAVPVNRVKGKRRAEAVTAIAKESAGC